MALGGFGRGEDEEVARFAVGWDGNVFMEPKGSLVGFVSDALRTTEGNKIRENISPR